MFRLLFRLWINKTKKTLWFLSQSANSKAFLECRPSKLCVTSSYQRDDTGIAYGVPSTYNKKKLYFENNVMIIIISIWWHQWQLPLPRFDNKHGGKIWSLVYLEISNGIRSAYANYFSLVQISKSKKISCVSYRAFDDFAVCLDVTQLRYDVGSIYEESK